MLARMPRRIISDMGSVMRLSTSSVAAWPFASGPGRLPSTRATSSFS